MKPRVTIYVGISLLVAGAIGTIPLLSRDAAPVEKYNRVTEGMTQQQVLDMMGAPDFVRHDKPETTTFWYGGLRRLKLNNMQIFFGADGRVASKFDDD